MRPIERFCILVNFMPILCPDCNSHEWTDETRGLQTCPECRTQLRFTPGRCTPLPPAKRHKFQTPNKAAIRRERNRLVLGDGKVACAMCGTTHRLMDSVDGTVSTNGTQKIRVQDGWRLNGNVFEPTFKERTIPRTVRGQICPSCAYTYRAKPVGRMLVDERPLTVSIRTYNTAEQRKQAESGAANWAHGGLFPERIPRYVGNVYGEIELHGVLTGRMVPYGDSSWLTGTYNVSVREMADGSHRRITTRSKHPAMCECTACMHRESPEVVSPVIQLDRMRYRGPLPCSQGRANVVVIKQTAQGRLVRIFPRK